MVTDGHSPLLHSLLQCWQQELLVEAVDGADVGEDSLNHITGERGAGASLLQEAGAEHLAEGECLFGHWSAFGRPVATLGRCVLVAHLIQEVELSHVGNLGVQQLIGDVEDPLLDGQLKHAQHTHTNKKKYLLNSGVFFLYMHLT